jgi:hypothetical protein
LNVDVLDELDETARARIDGLVVEDVEEDDPTVMDHLADRTLDEAQFDIGELGDPLDVIDPVHIRVYAAEGEIPRPGRWIGQVADQQRNMPRADRVVVRGRNVVAAIAVFGTLEP